MSPIFFWHKDHFALDADTGETEMVLVVDTGVQAEPAGPHVNPIVNQQDSSSQTEAWNYRRYNSSLSSDFDPIFCMSLGIQTDKSAHFTKSSQTNHSGDIKIQNEVNKLMPKGLNLPASHIYQDSSYEKPNVDTSKHVTQEKSVFSGFRFRSTSNDDEAIRNKSVTSLKSFPDNVSHETSLNVTRLENEPQKPKSALDETIQRLSEKMKKLKNRSVQKSVDILEKNHIMLENIIPEKSLEQLDDISITSPEGEISDVFSFYNISLANNASSNIGQTKVSRGHNRPEQHTRSSSLNDTNSDTDVNYKFINKLNRTYSKPRSPRTPKRKPRRLNIHQDSCDSSDEYEDRKNVSKSPRSPVTKTRSSKFEKIMTFPSSSSPKVSSQGRKVSLTFERSSMPPASSDSDEFAQLRNRRNSLQRQSQIDSGETNSSLSSEEPEIQEMLQNISESQQALNQSLDKLGDLSKEGKVAPLNEIGEDGQGAPLIVGNLSYNNGIEYDLPPKRKNNGMLNISNHTSGDSDLSFITANSSENPDGSTQIRSPSSEKSPSFLSPYQGKQFQNSSRSGSVESEHSNISKANSTEKDSLAASIPTNFFEPVYKNDRMNEKSTKILNDIAKDYNFHSYSGGDSLENENNTSIPSRRGSLPVYKYLLRRDSEKQDSDTNSNKTFPFYSKATDSFDLELSYICDMTLIDSVDNDVIDTDNNNTTATRLPTATGTTSNSGIMSSSGINWQDSFEEELDRLYYEHCCDPTNHNIT